MTQTSKYLYPNTQVLINKEDIQDQNVLNHFERITTGLRLSELKRTPIYGRFDFRHLQQIHKYIFHSWAGKIREEEIFKGNTMFARTIYIDSVTKELFRSLRNEKYLKVLKVDEFCEKAAYYKAEINMIHPFREGNGRTQREFIRTLALNAGYELNWQRLDKETILQASINSTTSDKDLQEVIRSCITNDVPKQELIRFYENLSPDLDY